MLSQTQSGTSLNAERALEILLALGEVGADGLSLAQIAQRLGGAKSAAHRSLSALRNKGFVEPAGRYGHYRLGPAIPVIARQQGRLDSQIQLIRPGMTEFARKTGFTAYLMVQAGIDAVCAEIVSRSPRRQFTMGVGARVPMGIAAGSMALLSIMPEDAVAEIIKANAERYAIHPALTAINAELIAEQVAQSRERGYAINMGYYLPGEGGLGLPIHRRHHYEVDVAVSFNAPIEMMTEEWISSMIDELRGCLGPDLLNRGLKADSLALDRLPSGG